MRTRKTVLSIALFALFSLAAVAAFAGEEAEHMQVLVKTNLGEFVIELYADKAPVTVENFVNYVDKKFYDGTIFHRVIPTFMVQGGGFLPDMTKKATGAPIENEAKNGLSNEEYTIAMARTGEPHSATCQFFINVKDNKSLDFTAETARGWGYAVFGKVISGTETIDKIKDVKTTTKGQYQNVPVKPVIIRSMSVIETEEE